MPGGEARPGQRDALIVATGRYQDPELAALRSPSRDAAELAAVLGDQAIGGFGVQVLLDRAGHVLREEIDGFLADRLPDDLLVLYLSCHGVKDTAGRLHFAASTTKLSRLASTGISASFVYEQVDQCQARRILLLLDCCYSGAYLKGQRPKAENRAGIRQFEGRGRAVITSCTALEYAFEMDTGHVTGTAAAPSVFTSALVEGLRTGQADRDGDGQVSVDDLYAYVFERVRETTPHQTPEKKWGEIRGDFIIARNPRPPAPGPDPAAAADSHSPKPGATRRAALKLGAVSAAAAGLAITGWDLTHHNPPTRRPPRKSTPAHTPLWTFNPEARPITWGPVVKGGVVYAATDYELHAIRGSDGGQLWKVTAIVNQGIVMLPGYIFTWNGGGSLFALRPASGRTIWQGRFTPTGPTTGPVACGNAVCFTDGYGKMYAVDFRTGIEMWTSVPAADGATAITEAGRLVYSGNGDGRVYALHVDNGREAWSHAVGESGVRSLAVIDKIAYIVSGSKVYAVQATDGAGIRSSWGDWIILGGQIAYTGTGQNLYALRPSDGTLLWSFPGLWDYLDGPPCISGTGPVTYASNGQGNVYALSADRGNKIWNSTLGGVVDAMISFNGVVYAAGNNLYALSASKGTQFWSLPIDVQTGAGMAIARGILYVGSTSGIHAFQI
jgi:outer membrane protein assembly factor BamB